MTRTVLLRFDDADLERVDRLRGLRPRQAFLMALINRFAEHADDQPIEVRTRPEFEAKREVRGKITVSPGATIDRRGATKLALTSPEASANALPPASPRYNRGASSPLVVMTPKSEIPRKPVAHFGPVRPMPGSLLKAPKPPKTR